MKRVATPDLFVSTSDFFVHATHAFFIGPASTLVFAPPTSLRFTLASSALRIAASNLFVPTAHNDGGNPHGMPTSLLKFFSTIGPFYCRYVASVTSSIVPLLLDTWKFFSGSVGNRPDGELDPSNQTFHFSRKTITIPSLLKLAHRPLS